jgi:hypothetical protein
MGFRHVFKHPIAQVPRGNGSVERKILSVLYLIPGSTKAFDFSLQLAEQAAAVFQCERLRSARERHASSS